MLKDLITLLLKSYEMLRSNYDKSFEIMLEPSLDAVYLSCTTLKFIEAIKSFALSAVKPYEIKYMLHSMTIKIPTKDR
jgi:hypothetical protein